MTVLPVLTLVIPVLTGVIALACRGAFCRTLLLAGSILHLGCTAVCYNVRFSGLLIGLDSTEEYLLLLLTSLLYFAVTVYSAFWLKFEEVSDKSKMILGLCLPLFLSTMTLVILAGNFGVMWVPPIRLSA